MEAQRTISHCGMGSGKRPAAGSTINKGSGSAHQATTEPLQTEKNSSGPELSPLPNLTQMRSSTMQMASDSQQNAPSFFNGLLKHPQIS